MRHCALIGLALLAVSQQSGFAAEAALNDQQQLGRRLFETSCGVCHTRPTLVAGMYGPELSKESANGSEEIMRLVITDGTPRMPAFKYTYTADQIAAIAAYLKTMPPGTQALPTAPSARP
jgi:mono/diheme cytochrome c family protein